MRAVCRLRQSSRLAHEPGRVIAGSVTRVRFEMTASLHPPLEPRRRRLRPEFERATPPAFPGTGFSHASFQKIMQPAWQPSCADPSHRVFRRTAFSTQRLLTETGLCNRNSYELFCIPRTVAHRTGTSPASKASRPTGHRRRESSGSLPCCELRPNPPSEECSSLWWRDLCVIVESTNVGHDQDARWSREEPGRQR